MERRVAYKMEAGTALFILEIFAFSVSIALRLSGWLNCDRRSMLITVMLVVALVSVLGFGSHVFRVASTVLFSLLWALLALELTKYFPESTLFRWTVFGGVFLVSLVFHKAILLRGKQ